MDLRTPEIIALYETEYVVATPNAKLAAQALINALESGNHGTVLDAVAELDTVRVEDFNGLSGAAYALVKPVAPDPVVMSVVVPAAAPVPPPFDAWNSAVTPPERPAKMVVPTKKKKKK